MPGPQEAWLADAPQSSSAYDYEIVLVTYRSRALLEELLPRFPTELPIVVVDNGRGVDGIAELVKERPGTRYVTGPGRGFGSGANVGARTSIHDVVIFLNPDCSPSVEQFDRLVRELRADPALALVGLTTVLPDSTVELGVGGWEPTVRRALVHAIGLHKLLPNAGLWARPTIGSPIDLDWLGAACMATPRRTFLELGGFDESYFVYAEDVELGRTIRMAGLRQKLLTDLDTLAPHLGGGSGQPRPQLLAMRGAMTMQYVRRHNRWTTAQGVRLALTAGYLARCLMCQLRGRRRVAQEHMNYLRGLWRGAPAVA